jgi:hypothetical protein
LVSLWSAFGQPLVSLWSAFGQPLVGLCSAFGQPLVSLWSAFVQPQPLSLNLVYIIVTRILPQSATNYTITVIPSDSYVTKSRSF